MSRTRRRRRGGRGGDEAEDDEEETYIDLLTGEVPHGNRERRLLLIFRLLKLFGNSSDTCSDTLLRVLLGRLRGEDKVVEIDT